MSYTKGDIMIPLGLLSPGEQGVITEIRLFWASGDPCYLDRQKYECRVEDMGLRIGKTVQMLNNGSPILLKVDESRIAVDRSMAMKIMIKEVGR
jgi:ferrous iron transport protein A